MRVQGVRIKGSRVIMRTGEYPWKATQEHLYEYACHEGNYAMTNMLRGARFKEAEDASKKQE